MTYNDWITELKANLLGVSEAERHRVLDYYAEAYADRRAAGYSESEIIAGFGAPYDAAQAILESDTTANYSAENSTHIHNSGQTQPPSPSKPTPSPKKKKTGVIIATCIIVSIVILLLIWTLVTIGINCAIRPEFEDANYTQQSENIQNLYLDFSVGEIETTFYDGDKIEIDYHTSNIYAVDISEKNGTLNFKLRSLWKLGWAVIDHPKTTIKLPANGVYNFKLDMSAGSATINGGNFGNLNLEMSAGNVNLNGSVKCEKFTLNASAGKINVDEIECSSLKIDLSAGVVDISTLLCPTIDIDLSAGSVNLGVNGKKSDYTITVDKSAGSCNVQNQTGADASKRIDIDLSAGSVNLSFSN